MAASNAVTQDTLIAVKLVAGNEAGENRRFKLPLKDLGPNTLPSKLRGILGVPESKEVTFERYSDSFRDYITLNSSDISIYKQLNRAAKAKLKLKIRFTIRDKTEAKAKPASLVAAQVSATSEKDADKSQPAVFLNSAIPRQMPTRSLPSKPMNDLAQAQAQMQAIRAQLEAQQKVQLAQMKTLAQQAADRSLVSQAPQPGNIRHDLPLMSPPHQPLSKCDWVRERQQAITHAAITQRTELQNAEQRHLAAQEETKIAEKRTLAAHIKPEAERQSLHESFMKLMGPMSQFSVCCNNCQEDIPGAHWHCSICMVGDYDLCSNCVESGYHCLVDNHFMVKRIIENGKVVNSTIETVPKKSAKVDATANDIKSEIAPPKVKQVVENNHKEAVPGAFTEVKEELYPELEMCRTCNSCVDVFEESNFVTCMDCEDYDLCIQCHNGNKHGHHPGHTFAPVSEDINLELKAKALCAPGRQTRHFAICDGCDDDILGVRHKCLTCPDWDFCTPCVSSASLIHPGHRFVPIYETIMIPTTAQAVHHGIRCDGPLCSVKSRHSFIVGDRYKCAICDDMDFCASCEALPTNTHNRTHPLIKFRTQVRNVHVTTFNEKNNGEPVDTLGDRVSQTSSKSTETNPAAPSANAATQVQTVSEVKPVNIVEKPAKVEIVKAHPPLEYQAYFKHDTVPDGSKMTPNTVFKQIWTVTNPGPLPWPAGCRLEFKGGDKMLNMSTTRPASISELEKAKAGEPIDHVVEVGREVELEMTLKSSERLGRAISYWKLMAPDGVQFGHKLWCDIEVENAIPTAPEPALPEYLLERDQTSLKARVEDDDAVEGEELRQSQMVFPTLEKESPASSYHDAVPHEVETASSLAHGETDFLDDGESLAFDDESSDDGFLTDEEYDILDNDSDASAANNGRKA